MLQQVQKAEGRNRQDEAVERTFATLTARSCSTASGRPRSNEARGAIVLFHRGHEHGARMAHLVDELDMPDYAFYAWDARGHGRSPGKRGYSPSFAASVRDVDCFMKEIAERDGFAVEDIAVVAQSVGAVLAATWVHDYAPKIRALVLASPAFSVKLYVPFAKQGIALWQKHEGRLFRQLLCEGEISDARCSAHCLLRGRPADHPADRLEHPGRALRSRRARGRRCPRHHGADATA